MARDFKVFISHSWDYVDDLMKLRNLMVERSYFNVEFNEVPPHDPINSENQSYVRSILKSKIRESHIVLAIAGIYASHSDWIEWELDTAQGLSVPILGIIPRGQTNLSRIVTSRSVADIAWNTESIVEAIRQYAKS